MKKYKLSFWFEHWRVCLWDKVNGVAIPDHHSLPISEELAKELDELLDEWSGFLDPNDNYKAWWTREQKVDFLNKSNEVYDSLIRELGSDYEVTNDVRERSLNNEV